VARGVKKCFSAKGPADIISILGLERTFGRRQDPRGAARKIQRFLSQPFTVAEVFTGTPGVYVSVKDTVRGFKESSTANTMRSVKATST